MRPNTEAIGPPIPPKVTCSKNKLSLDARYVQLCLFYFILFIKEAFVSACFVIFLFFNIVCM